MASLKVTPTPDEIAAAFARSKRRNWPATLAEALCNPTIRRLIEFEAWCHARRAAARAVHQARAADKASAAAPAAKPKGQLPLIHSTPLAMDHKRRASGERDDD